MALAGSMKTKAFFCTVGQNTNGCNYFEGYLARAIKIKNSLAI